MNTNSSVGTYIVHEDEHLEADYEDRNGDPHGIGSPDYEEEYDWLDEDDEDDEDEYESEDDEDYELPGMWEKSDLSGGLADSEDDEVEEVEPKMNTVHCTQCDKDRRVVDVMGGNYNVLGTCGHVQPKTD